MSLYKAMTEAKAREWEALAEENAQLRMARAQVGPVLEAALSENKRMRTLLERLDREGGLGLDVHDSIKAVLANGN